MEDLIIVKQLPVIEEQLQNLSIEIDNKVNNAKALLVNEETVKTVKNVRAELNKDFKELEDKRKQVKEQILTPYTQFEEVYKKYITDKFKSADLELKTKIDEVENGLKHEIEKEVKDYFGEYKTSKNIEFINFEQSNINITLSASKKSLKEQVKIFIDKVEDDINLIKTQDYKDEILVEYMKTLNISKSITEVQERHFKLEQVSQKQEESKEIKEQEQKRIEKVENIIAPVEEQKYKVKFEVTATKVKLQELKQFLNNGGYKYE